MLLDLVFVGPPSLPSSPIHQWLLGHGFAVAGTARVMNTVSASVWAHRLLQVLHIVRKACGRPAQVIAYGQSGGGAAARAFAQEMPHGIDGAIAMSTPGSGQVSLLNQALDATFAAKTLLAPGNDAQSSPASRRIALCLETEWTRVLSAAQGTGGRTGSHRARGGARATAGLGARRERNPGRLTRVISRRSRMAFYRDWPISPPGGAPRSCCGRPSSVRRQSLLEHRDRLRAAFRGGRRGHARCIQALYAQAGLDLGNDLARVNAAPRVAADPAGVDYARESTFDGRLAKPLLYMTTTGDPLLSGVQLAAPGDRRARRGGRGTCSACFTCRLPATARSLSRRSARRWRR